MRKKMHYQWIVILAIVTTLVGAAFMCGRGQTTPPGITPTGDSPAGGGPLTPPTHCSWKLDSAPRIVVIKWEYSGPTDIDGFRIYQGTTSLEVTVDPGTRKVSIDNLELNTQYHFDVRAFRGAEETPVDDCAVDATTGQ